MKPCEQRSGERKEKGHELIMELKSDEIWVIFQFSSQNYRVSQQASDLSWVDFDFVHSTVCLILVGLMRDRLS